VRGRGWFLGLLLGWRGVVVCAAEDAAGCGEGRRHIEEDSGLWIWGRMVRGGFVTVDVCFVLPVEAVWPLYFRGETVHY
jgi:hypothetical protein